MPGLVRWARYSGFLVLYPLGVASELTVVWLALPHLRARGHYTLTMPNAANFAFNPDGLFAITALAYIFGLPMVRTPRGAAPFVFLCLCCGRALWRVTLRAADADARPRPPPAQLYGYMLAQRRRALGPDSKQKSA